MLDACIVMTATIEPNTVLVKRSDVDQRLSDYKKCVEFYLQAVDIPIYFIENSRFDLENDPDFKSYRQQNNFRVIRIEALPDKIKGKGYQEFYALDYVIQNYVQESFIIKVTGRYLIRNIARIIPEMSSPISIDMHKIMGVAITGFFGISRKAYLEHVLGIYQRVNDSKGVFIEHVLYSKINSSPLRSKTKLLPQNPQYEGVSGSHGNTMERNKYKMMIRKVERRLSNSLGIHQFLIEY